MDKQQAREIIARRVAEELQDGDLVNLGIGFPTLVSDYVSEDKDVVLHAEIGFTGQGAAPIGDSIDLNITNAGGTPSSILPRGAFFDSATSFGIIRGGHLDVTVLGALQVDEKGNLANYMIPGKLVPGMGGAMDLVNGAKRVIIAMEHTLKGDHKIVKECTLPLTGKNCVDLIVTEMAVIEVTDRGLLLKEISSGYTLEEVKSATGADLIISEIFNIEN